MSQIIQSGCSEDGKTEIIQKEKGKIHERGERKAVSVRNAIGNLEDITDAGASDLKEVDLIAAEDTRNSLRCMNQF